MNKYIALFTSIHLNISHSEIFDAKDLKDARLRAEDMAEDMECTVSQIRRYS